MEKTTTYAQLQAMLAAELGVPAERQRIRYGFPPRELCAPEAERQEEDVPLQHGDRIVLEVPAPTGKDSIYNLDFPLLYSAV